MKKMLTLLILPLLFCQCSTPKETPEKLIAKADKAAENADAVLAREELRKLAREFISKTNPDWKVEGMNVLRSSGNHYFVYADVSQGNTRQTYIISAELFIKDTGETYWKMLPYATDADLPKYPNPSFLTSPHSTEEDGDNN